MKSLIKIEIPLSGNSSSTDEFQVDPPCFYCGAEVDKNGEHIWGHSWIYHIQYWGFTRKFGVQELGNVIDSSGTQLYGGYSLKLPFCPHHIKPLKTFGMVDAIRIYAGLAVGIAVFIWALVTNSNFRHEGWLLGLFAFPAGSLIMFVVIGQIIKSIIAKSKPELQDYSLYTGHYGVEVGNVRTDGGVKGIGPILYYLPLEFASVEIAKRFLVVYPQSIVTSGKELL